MSHLDFESIDKLTELSRIQCSKSEKQALLKDLENILTYFDELKEIDTENAIPCDHVLKDMANVMRDDTIGNVMPRDVFLNNAPEHTGGMIKVPPVITRQES